MAKPKPHEKHRQCKLRRGNCFTHSWIPAKFAVKGKVLRLKDEDGVWEDGWVVEEVWAEAASIDIIARAELWKKHREGTDAYREDGEWVGPRDRSR